MTETRFVSSNARRQARKAPNTETALFLATLAIGLSLLSLFAVIAFASFVELAHLLSLFALPLVLLVASALFLRRWAAGEAADKGIQESARYSSNRRPPRSAPLETERLTGHYIGDPQVYRDKEELRELRETRDPIEGLRRGLELSEEEWAGLDGEAQHVVDAAVEFAQASTDPSPTDALKNVYAP